MDCTHPPLVVASLFTASIAEFAFGVMGLGPAILYQILWEVLAIFGLSDGSLAEAVGNIVVIEAPTGIVQLYNLRQRFLPRLVALFCMPYGLMILPGTLILERFKESIWMKRLLGAVLLLLAAFQLRQRRRGHTGPPASRPSLEVEPRSWSTAGAIVAASATSGLMRGLFGVAGPPVMVLLMYFPVDAATFRCVAAAHRFTAVSVQSVLLGLSSDLRTACAPTYLSLMVGSLLGLGLGNMAASFVDKDMFQKWIVLFLASGALLMLCSGMKIATQGSAVLVAISLLAAALMPALPAVRRWLAGSMRFRGRLADFRAREPLGCSQVNEVSAGSQH